jgi:hypothetical protein
MVLRGGVLEARDPPVAIRADSKQCLDCVDVRVEACLACRNHADDRAKEPDVLREKAHVADLRDIAGRFVVVEDLRERRLDLAWPVHFAAIKADAVAVRFEQGCEGGGITRIPGFDQPAMKLLEAARVNSSGHQGDGPKNRQTDLLPTSPSQNVAMRRASKLPRRRNLAGSQAG